MTPELKNCPFCGENDLIRLPRFCTRTKKRGNIVQCDKCLSSSVNKEIWNTRCDQEREAALVEAIKNILLVCHCDNTLAKMAHAEATTTLQKLGVTV